MNLWNLKTFCVVYEKRSFTKATGVVHRTQPSISAQVAELEKYYGTQLFIRKGREITPTESGEILYRYAQRILKLADKTKEALDEFGGLMRGDVVLGASTIPGTYILPELLSDFKREYPDVRVSISISDTREVIERVMDGQLEIGLVGEKIQDKRLNFEPLAEDNIVLVVPAHSHLAKKRHVTLDILKKEHILVREEGSGTRGTVQKVLEKKGFKWRDLNVAMELGSTEAVKNGVVAGLGISFLSQWAIQRERKLGLISEVPVRGLDIQRHFYLVFHKGWPLSRATQVFLDFCSSKTMISMQGE
ncbi:MAG: LysR family transcriptional regulator [Gemmatimonadota bacterium]|nr:MAG: LysR family transcriptional regulator [Gemmatimonadota bacterium]